MSNPNIAPVDGRLGVLLPGMGAVATTLIAGIEAMRQGFGTPIGSYTQLARIRLGKRTESRKPLVKEFVPLQDATELVFAGWDPVPDDCATAARRAEVLEPHILDKLEPALAKIKPMPAAFDPAFVKYLEGTNTIPGRRRDWANQIRKDIQQFKASNNLQRAVMVWCGSTEAYIEPSPAMTSLDAFEKGLDDNDPTIPPSMIYTYAALMEGVAYANGAPNLSADVPAMRELAKKNSVPVCGKDFKTGQTLMKTILAPGLKARMLGIEGWFSTNILGNRDGLVLDDEASFKTKEVSKLSVLDGMLEPELYPDLYGDIHHKVNINYYPPRGDNKEGWDNIDIVGWMGRRMQIKIDFLCRDSVLAAPLVLDLALFLDLASRAGMSGTQEWLSFFFKSPMTAEGLPAEHNLFKQLTKLENRLRHLQGEELITHLGLDYYEDTNER